MRRNYNLKTQISKRKYRALSLKKMIYISINTSITNHNNPHTSLTYNDLQHRTTQD